MNKYMLNGLGDQWIFQANSPEEAEKEYLHQVGISSKCVYLDYCNLVGIDAKLSWEEV